MSTCRTVTGGEPPGGAQVQPGPQVVHGSDNRAQVALTFHGQGPVSMADALLGLHQFRHSAATHLGDKKVPLQLIMAKTRHKSPRTAMRYIKPGGEAVTEVTELLDPPPRGH